MTTTPRALDLIPKDSHDGVGPLKAYAVYTVHDTFQDLLSAAPSTLSSCITYRSMITARWVLKYIDYEFVEEPQEDWAAIDRYDAARRYSGLPESPINL